jgi:hypothetical protein
MTMTDTFTKAPPIDLGNICVILHQPLLQGGKL